MAGYEENGKTTLKRTTSIARRIHAGYWFKSLWNVVFLDFFILVIIMATYVIRCDKIASGISTDEVLAYEREIISHNFTIENDELFYLAGMADGTVEVFNVISDLIIVAPGGCVLIGVQIIHLFFGIFGTNNIRRKLRPLNDLAVKAEEFSRMSFDPVGLNPDKIKNLEHAIENVSPDSPDARIVTGDSDLLSIEVALNNLIRHMKDTQNQQTRFVSDASHELRTPIAVIQGYVNMLDRWGKEDESVLEESIEALKNESEHMKELIEQLLFLARGDSGRNTLNKVSVDINELMQEVYDESSMIDENHVYSFEGALSPCVIYGDIAMIKQSARIFIQNAAKYSPDKGSIKIRVLDEGDMVSYQIQDEGIGMNESDVNHIFERFYRSDKARNGETGGSGLGLSIAKWIVDAHDGTIDVISMQEIGTRFTVKFPKHI